MAIEINTQRDAVEVTWDPSLSSSTHVTLRCTSADDVSVTGERLNNGHTPVTYPRGYRGTTHIEVIDQDGTILESGDIQIDPPTPYMDVVKAAWHLHQFIWFYGEALPWPQGLEEITVLDGILSDALSRIPPITGGE
jgi:hypothetical protein